EGFGRPERLARGPGRAGPAARLRARDQLRPARPCRPGGTDRAGNDRFARRVRVEVSDPGPGFQPRTAGPEPGGFGLMLVERLADRWGVDPGGRSRVWFEIDRRS